jgi:hypothetical protein
MMVDPSEGRAGLISVFRRVDQCRRSTRKMRRGHAVWENGLATERAAVRFDFL